MFPAFEFVQEFIGDRNPQTSHDVADQTFFSFLVRPRVSVSAWLVVRLQTDVIFGFFRVCVRRFVLVPPFSSFHHARAKRSPFAGACVFHFGSLANNHQRHRTSRSSSPPPLHAHPRTIAITITVMRTHTHIQGQINTNKRRRTHRIVSWHPAVTAAAVAVVVFSTSCSRLSYRSQSSRPGTQHTLVPLVVVLVTRNRESIIHQGQNNQSFGNNPG